MISFLLASIGLTLSPGPDIIYVFTQSMANGKKIAITIASGLVSGILIHTSIVAFGIGFLIQQNQNIFLLLKIFGCCYLLFLAFQVYKSQDEPLILTTDQTHKTHFEAFKKGFIMNVLNPKVTLFFLAFLPSFIPKNSKNMVFDTFVLGFIFMLQAIIVFSLVSILADKLADKWRESQNFNRVMKCVQIFVFISIAGLLWFT